MFETPTGSDSISDDELRLLEAPLPCKRPNCCGKLAELTVRDARALYEYELPNDQTFRASSECIECRQVSGYSYDEILALIPPKLRPHELEQNEFWALALFGGSVVNTGDRCFIGERVCIRRKTFTSRRWVGTLLSPSVLAPSVRIGTEITGATAGNFEVCTEIIIAGNPRPVPTEMPRPASTDTTGMFVIPPSDDALLSANPFCANPACPHIFSYTYSKFLQVAHESRILEWFWKGKLAMIAGCNRCGTSRVIDDPVYDELYKV